METRMLGRLWPVSVLTLGGGGVGQLWGPTTRDECIATVRTAVDCGITLLDMAPAYGNGEAESVVGAAFEGRLPAGIRVTTKHRLGTPPAGEVESNIVRSLDESLARMRLERVDLFFLHSNIIPDDYDASAYVDRPATRWKTYIERFIPVCERLVADGRIGAWAITGIGIPEQQVAVLMKARKYAEALPIAERAVRAAEQQHGQDHLDVARPLSNLAFLFDNQGRRGDAEPVYKRALAVREKALGPEHLDVAWSLNSLAGVYRAQGRYAEAELLYKRSLAIREKALGPDHPDVGTSLSNLAGVYRSLNRYGEAEPLYKRSLAIREKTLGPEHADVGTMLNNLGGLYQNQGRYREAEPLYKRALAIREKALGPDHPDVGWSLSSLAGLYRARARYGEAEPLYARALSIHEKALGPDHPDVGKS